jgi:hypothetical protein
MEGIAMPLETPTPDGVLELFRDEIVIREAEIDEAYGEIAASRGAEAWDNPFPGVEFLRMPDGPSLMRVTYRRLLDGSHDEADRIRHELRAKLSHVDRPEGLEVICYTYGVVRTS